MKKQTVFLSAVGLLFLLWFFKCPLYNIIGVPCPACGMTRAWRYAIRLDFSSAFSMHPLFLLPLLVFVPAARKKWGVYTVFGIFIAVYIARMILMFPHTSPMNYNYNSLLGGFFK